MNKRIASLLLVIASFQVSAQSEFTTYDNGLIYSEHTMGKLKHIVDSLNLKYKVCDITRMYQSKCQTIGHFVELDTLDIKQARKDLQNNLSFTDFITKYPHAKIKENILIVKFEYTNYQNKEIVEYSEINVNTGGGFEIQRNNKKEVSDKALKNTWLFEYEPKTSFSKERIRGFFFPDKFQTYALSATYNKKIVYADCLIDTTTHKFNEYTNSGRIDMPRKWQQMSKEEQAQLLDSMRSTHVIGYCSQDDSPRQHAVNIALLSAETTHWGVFLKSHLDIMNDRFDRMSDGSYAYGARKTYIKELEDLDINVQDLLIGISLRIDNPADNHYYGSIVRLGRAISESSNRDVFMKYLLTMIEDDSLDYYNRTLMHFLYRNVNAYIEDVDEKNVYVDLLQVSLQNTPSFLKDRVVLKRFEE